MTPFRYGHAAAEDWQGAIERCLEALGPAPESGNLGFLYVTDSLAAHMGEVLDRFRTATGVDHWVGTVGMGICATGVEYYEQPAVAAMVAELPPDSFRVFPAVVKSLEDFDARHRDWIAEHRPYLGLVHGDPSNPLTEALIQQLAARTTAGFLVGGLASSRDRVYLYADGITQGGVAGVLFAEQVGVLTRLSQGCSPIGPQHSITEAQRNIMIRLDGEPALAVLKEDVGEILARDLTRIGGYIFVGLPIAGSDTGDYLVRNLVGIDPRNELVAIGDMVEPGTQMMFCRRDAGTAREDLSRMLAALRGRLSAPPRGAIYVSCLGRGVNLFGPHSEELRIIQDELGDFPLVGFYANGEISQDRLYGYTGVLTLFT
ncbi:MAG: FIST C-terminal domain-containing protein [Chromatiaceae bacterium]|jgi:small ligand-binding sensory domain FIST|nr:FIST C-terminal domain-containing protein [Chromatiaceae bacterium]